jgi:tetratricopeptide (TPR) repeat protein
VRAVRAAGDLASVRTARGEADALQWQERHATLVRELQRRDTTGEAALTVAKGYSDIGRLHVENGQFAAGEAAYRDAVRQFERVPRERRELRDIRDHSYTLKRLGGVLLRRALLDESEQRYREALALDQEALRLDDRPQTRYDITFTLSDLALVQSRRGLWSDAVALWNQALAIRKAAMEADPRNVRAMNGTATLYGRLAIAAQKEQDLATTVARYREELRLREDLRSRSGDLPGNRADRAWAALRLAEALLDRAAGDPRDPAREGWLAEARWLVGSVRRTDGKASVPAGSEPGFVALYDALTARAGH